MWLCEELVQQSTGALTASAVVCPFISTAMALQQTRSITAQLLEACITVSASFSVLLINAVCRNIFPACICFTPDADLHSGGVLQRSEEKWIKS